MEFDENDAIDYMRSHVEPQLAARYTDDDQLVNLIDLIYDYFEANGLLDIDVEADEDDDIDIDDLNSYILRMLRKDKGACLRPEDVPALVQAYLDYEDSL